MSLSKYRLGDLISQLETKNLGNVYGLKDVRGISIKKEFIFTKADMNGVSLSQYLIVPPNSFAYVPITSRNGEKITIALNRTNKNYIVSSSYLVFRIIKPEVLLPDFLFMFFNRPEFDRYARFNSWGSAREAFSYESMENVEISVPDIPVQRKYIAVFNEMRNYQDSLDAGLGDLKMVCDGFLGRIRKKYGTKLLGRFIEESQKTNNDGSFGDDSVVGLSTQKEIISTKADLNGVNLNNYKLYPPQHFAYVPDTSRRGDKVSLAFNNSQTTYLVSSISIVFYVNDLKELEPNYLSMIFNQSEFDRYARFHSWGSAREPFSFDEMKRMEIPMPDITTQKAISNIFACYKKKKADSLKMEVLNQNICPVLIDKALKEASL